jgi:hypothetical protein
VRGSRSFGLLNDIDSYPLHIDCSGKPDYAENKFISRAKLTRKKALSFQDSRPTIARKQVAKIFLPAILKHINITVVPKNMKTTLAALATILFTSWATAKEQKPLIVYRIGDVPVAMREDDEYGVMLVNDGWEEDPSPRYIVAIAKTRTVVDTKDLEVF